MNDTIATPPEPFPSRIVTLLEPKFTTTRSGFPSRLKSPTAMDWGLFSTPTGEPAAWVNAPEPLPSRIVTVFEPPFVTARSAVPSRLKSPTAVDEGKNPTLTGDPPASVSETGETQTPDRHVS